MRDIRAVMRDSINRAFVARDKASVAVIHADAEAELEHAEPDGDEASGSKTVNVHVHGNSADATEARFKKLEDGFASLDAKIAKVLDAVSSRDDFPPKKEDEDDDKTDEGDDDKKTDDEDGDDKKDDDADKKETTDEEEGALTATAPASVEPDLMEADPALKTGPSMMGDATYKARVNTAMNNLIKDTKARAEMLAPGIQIGVLDGAMGDDRMKQAGIRVCDTRRAALMKAVTTADGQQATGRYTADSIKTMSCDAVRMLFISASDNMRAINNAKGKPSPTFGPLVTDRRQSRDAHQAKIAEINKVNADFWAKRGGTARSVH